MHKLLVIMESADLLSILQENYSITFCPCAEDAAKLLKQNFDGMIIDLFLPGTDGLALLEQSRDHLPPVILVLTRLLTPYVVQAVEELCGGYILRLPCHDQEIIHRLEDMFRKFDMPVPDTSAATARYHLHRLGLSAGKGFSRMMEILPNYDPDNPPYLFKDCYPSLAQRDSVSMEAIDNSIHRTIQLAYKKRNDAVWKEYFPSTARCPKNKDFLFAVAERIKSKNPSR